MLLGNFVIILNTKIYFFYFQNKYAVIELTKKSNLKYACCCTIPLGKTCCRESELQYFAMQSFST